MPNHVTIQMSVTGAKPLLETFITKHFNAKQELDFHSFAPIPAELQGTTSPSYFRKDEGMDDANNERLEEPFKAKNAQLVELYGHDNWYDWQRENWGTKWNSYDNDNNLELGDYEEQSINVNFQTAWSLPIPIFEKMAELYPDLSFEVECCEEGGYFAGRFAFKGDVVEDELVDGDGWDEWAAKFYGYPIGEDGKVDWDSME